MKKGSWSLRNKGSDKEMCTKKLDVTPTADPDLDAPFSYDVPASSFCAGYIIPKKKRRRL